MSVPKKTNGYSSQLGRFHGWKCNHFSIKTPLVNSLSYQLFGTFHGVKCNCFFNKDSLFVNWLSGWFLCTHVYAASTRISGTSLKTYSQIIKTFWSLLYIARILGNKPCKKNSICAIFSPVKKVIHPIRFAYSVLHMWKI